MIGEEIMDPAILGAGEDECEEEASELLHSSESRRVSSTEESLRIVGCEDMDDPWFPIGVDGGVRLRLLAECLRDFLRSLLRPPSSSMYPFLFISFCL